MGACDTEDEGQISPLAKLSHLNTKTALQLDAVEQCTIALIAIFLNGKVYRSYIVFML
jgi:hypothetical protein